MSLVVKKLVFRVFDLVRHKPGCTIKEDGSRCEISYLGSRGIVLLLIWVFVFAFAKSRFSQDAALIIYGTSLENMPVCFLTGRLVFPRVTSQM